MPHQTEMPWLEKAWPLPGLAGLFAVGINIWLWSGGWLIRDALDGFGVAALLFGAFAALSRGKAWANLPSIVLGVLCLVVVALRLNGYPYNAPVLALLVLGAFAVAMFRSASAPLALRWRLWFAGSALVYFLFALYGSLACFAPPGPELWEGTVLWFPATGAQAVGAYLSLSVWRKSRNPLALGLAGLCGAATGLGVLASAGICSGWLQALAGHGG